MARYSVPRKNAVTLATAIREFLQQGRLASGMNTRLVYAAWDEVSGAGAFTLKRYFRDGRLYITLNSSVVRSQLNMRKAQIMELINDRLAADEFFCKDEEKVSWVEDIILK